MKTYYWTPDDMELDRGPHGSWVKTADHFETVGALETQLRDLNAQVKLLQELRARDLTQLTALVEQLAKGVAAQAPGPVEMRLGVAEWHTIHGEIYCRKCADALHDKRMFEFDGRLWIVEEWHRIRGLSVKINAKLRPVVSA
jgi:hypothetical protein